MVDRASPFLFAYHIPSKEAHGVARLLLDLRMTFGVFSYIRADGGGEFTASETKHLCCWRKVNLHYRPADHPRGQGDLEEAGERTLDALPILCTA